MKKLIHILTILFFGLFNANAQTSIEIANNSAGGLIVNNDIITEDVAMGAQSHVYAVVKNISSTTKTYGLRRTDVVLNTGAEAYFCFGGSCFGSGVTTAPAANYVTLTAGQSDVPTQLYYDENMAAGYSEIKYEVYNVNNPNDVVTFTFKFNPLLLSVKNNTALFSSVSEVYPNPSINKAQIIINSRATINNATISITNALGSVVSLKNIELSIGKNEVSLDSENLNSGIYFATISSNHTKVVKKFTVNK